MKRKPAATLAILVSAIFAGVQLKASLIEDAKAAAGGEWISHEDQILRFSHPKGWRVWQKDESSTRKQRVWTVDPPPAAHEWGMVYITEHTDGSQKSSLKQIFSEQQDDRTTVIKGPKHWALKGLKCLVYTSEYPAYPNCGDDISQNENERLACIEATASALCYTAGGHYVSIWADLSRYYDSGQADELRDNNAAIFDRFLKSLEFKLVAESSPTRKGN